MPKGLVFWVLYFLSLGLLTYLSLTPIGESTLPKIPYFDKLAHCGFYFLLGFLFLFSWYKKPVIFSRTKRVVLFSVCFHVLYGIVIEVIQQKMIPGRLGEWEDAMANTTGVVAATFLSFFNFLKKPKLN